MNEVNSSLAESPSPQVEFTGRDSELETLNDLVREQPTSITVTGPPGVGKSRLAYESIKSNVDAFDAVDWIACRTVRGEADFLRVVGRHFEVSFERGATVTDAKETLGDLLSDHRGIIVFDNLEQTGAGVREILAMWSERADACRFVLTSREPLGLVDERVLSLAPMPESDAATLYVRAVEARQLESPDVDPEAAASLGRQLGGIPLSLELAAARALVFGAEQLLERVQAGDEPLREPGDAPADWERSLERSVARSWDILTPGERLALAEASVFENGATIDALESVLEPATVGADTRVPQLIQNLVRKSLMYRRTAPAGGEPRFSLYVPVLDFVVDRRSEVTDVEAIRRRHAHYYARCAEGALDERYGSEDLELVEFLAPRLENLLAAHEWALEDAPETAARIAEALASYDRHRGLSGDLVDLFERTRDALRGSDREIAPTHDLRVARLLHTYRLLTDAAAGSETAEALRRVADRAREHECHRTEIDARFRVSMYEGMCGAYERAIRADLRAVEAAERMGEDRELGRTLAHLGHSYMSAERYEEAREAYERAERLLTHSDSVDDPWQTGRLYLRMVELELSDGRIGRARDFVERAVARLDSVDEKEGLAYARSSEALVCILVGAGDRALDAATEATDAIQDLQRRLVYPYFWIVESFVYLRLGRLRDAERRLEETEHLARDLDATAFSEIATLMQALVAYRRGHIERGDRRHADVSGESDGSALERVVRAERELAVATRRFDRDQPVRALEMLASAARIGLPDPEAETPFYRGSTEGFIASQLFADEFGDLQGDVLAKASFSEHALFVETHESRWFKCAGGDVVDLGSRHAMRRIFDALVRARIDDSDRRLSLVELLAAGWPDADPASISNSRGYTAVSRLRDAGLEDVLRSDSQGYRLAPEFVVVRLQNPPSRDRTGAA